MKEIECSIREGVKKTICYVPRPGGQGGGVNPLAATKIVFFVFRENDAECSEMENYAEIFGTFFQRYKLKT